MTVGKIVEIEGEKIHENGGELVVKINRNQGEWFRDIWRNWGGLISQADYREAMADIEASGRGYDTEGVQAWMDALGIMIDRHHPNANILACLYEFAKGVRDMIPVFQAHPEWATSDPMPEFEPRNQAQSVGDIVATQKRNAKRNAKRRQAILA